MGNSSELNSVDVNAAFEHKAKVESIASKTDSAQTFDTMNESVLWNSVCIKPPFVYQILDNSSKLNSEFKEQHPTDCFIVIK